MSYLYRITMYIQCDVFSDETNMTISSGTILMTTTIGELNTFGTKTNCRISSYTANSFRAERQAVVYTSAVIQLDKLP